MQHNRTIKTVFIAIPLLLVGGTEMQTLNLVNVLLSAGYNVTVCCYYEYDQNMVSRFESAGAKVHLMKYERTEGLWHLAKGLSQFFKTIKPDIMHVQYIAPGLIPVVAAQFAGIRTIFATVHQPGRVYGLKENLFVRIALRLSTAFICNSKSVEESWFGSSEIFDPQKTNKKRKHFTIYNGIDVSNIDDIMNSSDPNKLRAALGIGNKPIVGVAGRLRWEKGQSLLLDALAEVIKEIPDVILLVVGDGPDRIRLELKAKSLGIENHILWLGQKEPDEVIRLYGIMNVLAVPSLFEGFGLVAAEAMTAGVPVVGSKIDGLSEVIEDNLTGLLVPATDSLKLSEAIIRMLNNPAEAKRMGLHGKKRVKELFSMDLFSRNIVSAYKYFSSN